MEVQRYCFTKEDLGRYLHNLGYYFTALQEYRVAYGCYMVSMAVMDKRHPGAMAQIQKLEKMGTDPLDMDQSYAVLRELGIPSGGNDDTASLAYAGYQHFLDQDNKPAAAYYLSIACQLTEDETLLGKLAEIRKELENADN